MKIAQVIGREIYDSRGWPTVECQIVLDNGTYVAASVPSGTSRGSHEACELRDGDDRLFGYGVSHAVSLIEDQIGPALIGKEPEVVPIDLQLIEMDGTEDKSALGANTMLAVSIAVCRAHAVASGIEPFELVAYLCDLETVSIPLPMFNMINGGVHADNNLAIQEILLVPTGFESYRSCLEAAVTVFHKLGKVLHKHGKRTLCGYEGGYAPLFSSETEAFDLLLTAAQEVEAQLGGGFVLGIDVAASEFYNKERGTYYWHGQDISSDQLIAHYQKLTETYPIYSIEDGLAEDDWDGWERMYKELHEKVLIVGDDLFATNPYRIARGIEGEAANAVVIKPNQIGTVTEALQSIKLCQEHGVDIVVSHRSGETNDPFIVDLAVGVSSNYVKAGGLNHGERLAKYNRLLRIEDSLMLSLLDI